MNLKDVSDSIQEVMIQNGKEVSSVKPETDILNETSLDSLDLALVIVMLEEKTGKDPFSKGFIPFRTVGELAKLYE